jgi:ribosomal protein S7
MPKVLEKLVNKLISHGKPKSNAYAIATAALQKQGKLKKGTQKLKGKK